MAKCINSSQTLGVHILGFILLKFQLPPSLPSPIQTRVLPKHNQEVGPGLDLRAIGLSYRSELHTRYRHYLKIKCLKHAHNPNGKETDSHGTLNKEICI